MPDRLVQHHAGPAGAQHDFHLAGRGRDGVKIDQGDSQRFVDLGLPILWIDIAVIAKPPAGPGAAALHTIAVADHDRDVEPDQGPDIGDPFTAGAQDLDCLPGAGQRRRDLADPLILGPGVGVDLLQQLDLGLEFHPADRVLVGV